MFRSFILIVALLAQALPVSLLASSAWMEECSMSCCEWQKKVVVAETCGCVDAVGDTQAPAPATLPSAIGRDLVPTPLWVTVEETLVPQAPHSMTSVRPTVTDMVELPQPHVRLSVLFCSFLT